MSPGMLVRVRSLAEACQKSRDALGHRESGPWQEFKAAFYELVKTPLNDAAWDTKREVAREKFVAWKTPKGDRKTSREREGWNIRAIENFLALGQIQPVDPFKLATFEAQRQQSLKRLFLTPSGRRFQLPSMATTAGLIAGAATRGDAVSSAVEDYQKARKGLLEEDSAEEQAMGLVVEQGAGAASSRFAGALGGRVRGGEEAHAETVSLGLQKLYKSVPTPKLPRINIWRPGPDYFRDQVQKIAESCVGTDPNQAELVREMMAVFMALDFTGAYNAAFNGISSLSEAALRQVPGIASLFKLKAFCEAMGSLLGELSTRRQVRRNLQKGYYRPGQVAHAIQTLQLILDRSVCTKSMTAARAGMTFAVSVTEAVAAGTQIATTIASLVDAAVAALQYLADIAIAVYDCVTANIKLAAWERDGGSSSNLDNDTVSPAEADVLGNPALAAVLLSELDEPAVVNVSFDLMATQNFTDIVSKVVEKGAQVKVVARRYVEALPMKLEPPFQGWGANSQANAVVNGPPTPPPQPAPGPSPNPAPPGGDALPTGGSVAASVQVDLVSAVEEEFIPDQRERHRIGENLVTAVANGVAQAVRAYEQTLGRSENNTTELKAGRQFGGFGIRTFANVSQESAAAVNYFKSPDFAGDLQRCKAEDDFRSLYDYVSKLCSEPLQFQPDTSDRFSQKKLKPLNKDGHFRNLLVAAVTNDQAMTCLAQLAGD